MEVPTRILVDWGGTVIRDSAIFQTIADASGSPHAIYDGPQSWDGIKSIGHINAFDDIVGKKPSQFFRLCEEYPGAVDTISSYCGSNGMSSRTEVYVVFDNRPPLEIAADITTGILAKDFHERGGRANGFYTDANKQGLAKRLQIKIAVEDDPRIALSLASLGIYVVLLLRKWNRLFSQETLRLIVPEQRSISLIDNIILVEDWMEAKEVIDKLIEREGEVK